MKRIDMSIFGVIDLLQLANRATGNRAQMQEVGTDGEKDHHAEEDRVEEEGRQE